MMLKLLQTQTPFLTKATSGIQSLIVLHKIGNFVQKNWIWLLLVLAALGYFLYRVKVQNEANEKKFKATLQQQKEAEQKNKPPMSQQEAMSRFYQNLNKH